MAYTIIHDRATTFIDRIFSVRLARDMKAKNRSRCPYIGTLFKSSPPLCKNCAMKYNYQNKEKVSENGLNKAREVKKYVIPKVSEKQAKINQVYSVLRKQLLKDNPFCQVGKTNHLAFIWCNKKATSIHHAGSGSNKRKYYLDTTTWFSTCDYCHDVIHTLLSAEELYELGLKIRT